MPLPAVLIRRFLPAIVSVVLSRPTFAQERPDLALTPGRWEVYANEVAQVSIDRNGRAWFMLDPMTSADPLKKEVEQSCRLRAPWVHGRIQLFDSQGRIWLTSVDGILLGYDIVRDNWIEHLPDSWGPDWQAGWSARMTGPVIEDSAGRIFVGESRGVTVFDKGKWSFQPLYSLNFDKKQLLDSRAFFDTPQFAEDVADHRMYVWTRWANGAGTLGFWIFEDNAWRQMDSELGTLPGRLKAVVPLDHNRVILLPERGPLVVRHVYGGGKDEYGAIEADIRLLGDPAFAQRRDAQRRLLELGPPMVPKIKEAIAKPQPIEVRTRLQNIIDALQRPSHEPRLDGYAMHEVWLFCRDGEGNAVVYANSTLPPGGPPISKSAWLISPQGRVSLAPREMTDWAPSDLFKDSRGRVFAAIHRNGMGVLQAGEPARIVDFQDEFYRIFGEDRQGRLYSKTRLRVVAMTPDEPDDRRALVVSHYDLPGTEPAVSQDSEGRTVAALAGKNGLLSRFEHGRWNDLPAYPPSGAQGDVNFIQPLFAGGFIVGGGGHFSHFDGVHWKGYANLHQLVEDHYSELVDAIDNRSRGTGGQNHLRSDAYKNIWCCEWDHVSLFDGAKWSRWLPPLGTGNDRERHIVCCFPFDSGRRMILGSLLVSMTARAVSGSIQSDIPRELPTAFSLNQDWMTLHVDSHGTAMVADLGGTVTRLKQGALEKLSDIGFPRLEDSWGRLWIVNAWKRKLVILSRDGSRAELPEDGILDHTTVVEERPGSYWVNTQQGLLHLLQRAEGSPITREGSYYEKNIPQTSYPGMWIDPERNLWISNGAQRIYRVELP